MTRFFKEIKRYYQYVIYASKCELRGEVANSYLNWVWWILEPLAFMFVYAIVFGKFFNAPEENFIAFIFLGLSLWGFFNKMVSTSVKLVKNNKSIVSKVYVPKYILIIEKMCFYGFKMLIEFGVEIVIMIIMKIKISINILWFIPTVAILMILTFGICCFITHFGVYIEDLSYIVSIGLRLLFYLSGIFYDVTKRISAPYGEWFEKINPIAFLLNNSRRVLLYCQSPRLLWMGIWLLVGILISILGIALIQKNENNYVKVV